MIGSELFHPANERGGYCSARMTFIEVFWAAAAAVAAVINVRPSRHNQGDLVTVYKVVGIKKDGRDGR